MDIIAPHPTPPFLPADHYWRRADGRLYASAAGRYVDTADPAYRAWLARGNAATPFPRDAAGRESDAELAAVLADHGLTMAGSEPPLFITRTGVYHRHGCPATRSVGEWLPPAALAERFPDARPCGNCRPVSASILSEEDAGKTI